MKPSIILQGVSTEEFAHQIELIVEQKLAVVLAKHLQPPSTFRYLSRKEVAALLHITLPTLHDWTKLGWLKSYRIGTRVLYKSDEIDESVRCRKFGRYS